MSSHQPADLTGIIGSLDPRPECVIVRLYLPGERPPQSHSLAQIASARANGCTVGAYIWTYPDFDPRQSVRDALALAARADLSLSVLWLDLETYEGEPGPGVEWLRAAADECQRNGVQAGIYTGLWYIREFLPGYVQALGNLPLWLAEYEGGPTLDGVTLPAGLARDRLWGKQWCGTGIDRDIFLEVATQT